MYFTNAQPPHPLRSPRRTRARSAQGRFPEALLTPRIRTAAREAVGLLARDLEGGTPRSLQSLLQPLRTQALHSPSLKADALGIWEDEGRTVFLPRFHFLRATPSQSRIKVGIFAGIHGDEPAGILGLMDFLREWDATPGLGRFYELWLYPVCNPTGYLDGTRHSRSGKDLNREFWKESTEREVRLLEREIRRQRFDGIISLHSDDTSAGFYGFARGTELARQLLAPALAAAEAAQDRDTRPCIDGFQAINGMIHDSYEGILSAPPEQAPHPFEIILESPALSALEDQRKALQLALNAILEQYLPFIAYGADL